MTPKKYSDLLACTGETKQTFSSKSLLPGNIASTSSSSFHVTMNPFDKKLSQPRNKIVREIPSSNSSAFHSAINQITGDPNIAASNENSDIIVTDPMIMTNSTLPTPSTAGTEHSRASSLIISKIC